jgi:uncharacterized membrane protein
MKDGEPEVAEAEAPEASGESPNAPDAAASAADDAPSDPPLGRPVPAFRRFAARRDPAAETDAEPPAPTAVSSHDESQPSGAEAVAAPPADEPTVVLPDPDREPLGAAGSRRAPVVETVEPAAPEPAPRGPAATPSSATEAPPAHPAEAPPRDLQGELDASAGCPEWFDRRPAPKPPAPAPSPPHQADPAGAAGPAIATALPTFEPAPALEPLRPVRAPRTEFDGGDVGAGPDRLAALLGYLLLIVGAPTAGAGLVLALLLAWRLSTATTDWRQSHYLFQVRTAVIALAVGFACGVALFIDYVGVLAAPVLVLLTGWVVLRAAAGLHHLFQGRPHPNYRTWFV